MLPKNFKIIFRNVHTCYILPFAYSVISVNLHSFLFEPFCRGLPLNCPNLVNSLVHTPDCLKPPSGLVRHGTVSLGG